MSGYPDGTYGMGAQPSGQPGIDYVELTEQEFQQALTNDGLLRCPDCKGNTTHALMDDGFIVCRVCLHEEKNVRAVDI